MSAVERLETEQGIKPRWNYSGIEASRRALHRIVFMAKLRGIIVSRIKRACGTAEAWPEGLRVAALVEETRMRDTSEDKPKKGAMTSIVKVIALRGLKEARTEELGKSQNC